MRSAGARLLRPPGGDLQASPGLRAELSGVSPGIPTLAIRWTQLRRSSHAVRIRRWALTNAPSPLTLGIRLRPAAGPFFPVGDARLTSPGRDQGAPEGPRKFGLAVTDNRDRRQPVDRHTVHELSRKDADHRRLGGRVGRAQRSGRFPGRCSHGGRNQSGGHELRRPANRTQAMRARAMNGRFICE